MDKLEFKGFDIEKHYDFLFDAHKETFKITFGIKIDEELFLRELAYEEKWGVGVFLQDEPIGICDLQIREREGCKYGWVHFIFLKANYRGRGLGSCLIKDYCCKNNLNLLGLRTGKGNIAAQKFYKREGFKREATFDTEAEIGYKLEIF